MLEQSPLQRVREERGLSRARLAGLTELTSQAIYNLERGARPRLDTARKIAEALGVALEDVFPTESVAQQ